MSSVNCPYDGTWCEEKAKRIEDWCDAIKYYTKNHINYVHYTGANTFEGYPRDRFDVISRREGCIRYQRYMNIVNKIKAIEKQMDGR